MSTLRRLCTLFVILAFLTVAGCSSNNTGKIEGTKWSSMATTVDGTPIPAGALSLEFTSDGKLKYVAGFQTFTGTYSLGMMDYVTFNLDQAIEGRKQHLERIKIDGTNLEMIDSDGTSLKFTKAN